MRTKKILKIIGIIILILMLSPLWMYVFWFLTPKRPIKIAIVDKTVLNISGTEHESFNWVLRNDRYCCPNGRFYTTEKDYFGFFPGDSGKYTLKGFEQLPPDDVAKVAEKYDMLYITDAYGIYYNEWFKNREQLERSPLIYGGLSLQDLVVLSGMKQKKKLILTEFNTIASPTSDENRHAFEKTFDLKWTGWVGRYFNILDSSKNPELPHWLTRNYRKQHHDQWPFKKSGIVFVREDDHIEVLEMGTELKKPLPIIVTGHDKANEYNLPASIKYPYWFDIITSGKSNEILSSYSLDCKPKGDSILNAYHIPHQFPAVIAHSIF